MAEFEIIGKSATKLPVCATARSAGYDLYAAETVTIKGGEGITLVKTGVTAKFQPGFYGRLAMRSSLALNQHLIISGGVIDADYYPGEIGLLIACLKNGHSYTINAGDRCAQLIVEQIAMRVEQESSQQRTGGFGSTGK